MNRMRIEEEHTDILQNMEFAINSVHKENPTMSDHSVTRAVDALIEHYRAVARNHVPKATRLDDPDSIIFHHVWMMCEYRLGRSVIGGEPLPDELVTTPDVILACLRRIKKSVEFWNEYGGRQGYLTYISNFIA